MPTTAYLIFFAANLVFIVTHLYGWLLKWYYKPKAYSEDFHALFPAQRAVGVIYLLQLFELPYLVQAGLAATSASVTDGLFDDALFYVNAFGLMCFSFQTLVMCEGYFFPQQRHSLRDYWLLLLPAVLVLVPLFLKATGLLSLLLPAPEGEGSSDGWRFWAKVAVAVAFVYYLWLNVSMALKIGRAIRRANEDTYADTDDFPLQFAQFIQWIPTLVIVLHAANFYLDDPWVKFVRDLIFIGANVAFCVYTLNPGRKGIQPHPQPLQDGRGDGLAESAMEMSALPSRSGGAGGGSRLSDDRYDELARRLDALLTEEHIFTEPHITSALLMQRLGINANYLSEVIRRSGYSSFYDMVNQHRVRHAITLITQQPDLQLQDIASRCGFSTPSSMARSFRQLGKPAPSTFRNR